MLVTRGRRAGSRERHGAVRAARRCAFRPQTVKASTSLPDLDKYQGPPLEFGRMEATASDPGGAAAVRHDRRHARTPAGQCARDAQHPRRALGHLPRRFRPASVARGRCRRARRRSASIFRQLPDALERAAELDAQLRTQSRPRRRCRCTASCSRSRTRSTPRTCARPAAATRLRHRFSGARSHAGRAAAQQGRDHLRQGGQHRIQRPRRRSRRPAQARQGAALDARLSAQHLGRQSVEPLRHDARGLARLELGLGAVGQRQSGDGEPRRGDARVVPRPVQPQRGGADPAAQGDARLRRRRDRRRHLLRPQRHPSAARIARLRQGARCAEGSGRRLLRSARSLHDRAALVGAEHAATRATRRRRRAGRAQGHAHRRHPRVDGVSARARRPRSRSSPPPRRRSRRSSAASSARRWWNRPIRCGRAIPTSRP